MHELYICSLYSSLKLDLLSRSKGFEGQITMLNHLLPFICVMIYVFLTKTYLQTIYLCSAYRRTRL